MKTTDVVARINQQEGNGEVALIQGADEQHTEVFVDNEFSFTTYHHPGTFSSKKDIEEFIRENANGFGVSIVGDDGEVEMEFVADDL